MHVSKVFANVQATPKEIANLEQLAKFATANDYSLGVFKDKHRSIEKFQYAEAVALDFDSGPPIADMVKRCEGYAHAILPTKSHQKDKNGVVCDRYRVIIPLEKPITDADTYYATYESLLAEFPEADKACKDPARQFYKSIGIASVKSAGKRIAPVAAKPKPELKAVPAVVEGVKGDLSKRTLKFLQLGAPVGSRHAELYQAARDAKQQGYPQAWFERQIGKLVELTGDIAYADSGSQTTIKDAFTKDAKHPPRVEEKAFAFMPIGELLSRNIKVDWIVSGLLTKAGTSIFAGAPKSGKSTLVRQLVANICRGEPFLGHKTKQGNIVYCAFEEQDAMLKADFQRLGITSADPIQIHVGGALTMDAVRDLEAYLHETRPMLTVIDTLMDLAQIKNTSDYAEVKTVMARLRKIARDTETHMLFVHHGKKPSEGQSAGGGQILGSTAFFGGVDMTLVLNVGANGKERMITTQGRGIKMYSQRQVIFDQATHTFTLGPDEDGF